MGYGATAIQTILDYTNGFAKEQRWDYTQWIPDAVVILIGPNDEMSNKVSAPRLRATSRSSRNRYSYYLVVLVHYFIANLSHSLTRSFPSTSLLADIWNGFPHKKIVVSTESLRIGARKKRHISTQKSQGGRSTANNETSVGASKQFVKDYIKLLDMVVASYKSAAVKVRYI